MLQYQINTKNVYLKNNSITCPLNNLSQSLLIEIAYQYLPPSGLPIQIPRVIHKVDWYSSSLNSEKSLPNDITLNEYEQAFSYIRWYQLEESIITYNVSPYTLSREVQDFIDDDKSDTDY
ncbi:uncharacterized protein LOC113464501 [Ceratina calcarata]|uniref:Uncharacterized protein LOC113464501 n=1 Tax=Ceratina calcarata TaxID=156304 RepID=A0AAJ7S2Z3_9HYME|nr:uncharacterized protein LOC113464501 [Ceratina calcarata]